MLRAWLPPENRGLRRGRQALVSTSSVRTLYRPDAPFMLKLSLGIGITNSVRINLARELLRGDDMYRFRQVIYGTTLNSNMPA